MILNGVETGSTGRNTQDTEGSIPSTPPSIYDWVYLAGLMDGEGSIMLLKSNSNKFKVPVVSITSTDYEIIHWLQTTFNGEVIKRKKYKDHYKQAWVWRVRNKELCFFILEGIKHHLKIHYKTDKTNLILENYNKVTIRNGKYTKEQKILKENFELEFDKLN